MTSREWRDNRLCGELIVRDEATASLLENLLAEDSANDYPCIVEDGDPDNVAVGDSFTLQFGAVRTAVGLVVPDIQGLLRSTELAAGTADISWYVHSLDAASWEEESELCLRLQTVKRLVKALEGAAAIFDHRKATLVFLQKGRFDVPINYSDSDLMQFDQAAVEKLIADLELKDGHAAQRQEIGATAVCELLAGVSPSERFSTLLRKASELYQRFVDGYKLFASSFSFEKIRDQAEALRIEYTGKIHKTLSDIQGQLLGIPISTIIVATQFKSITTDPGNLWVNSAILAGAFIFCVLLLFSLWNQYQTLEVITQEVNRHEAIMKKDSSDIAGRLQNVFGSLHNRITLHMGILIAVGAIATIGLLIAAAVFWILCSPAF
ncbi:hypothetical protein [Oryzomicrobium sp.]|uniref:hypothetical protein n=1 Tax=Oryzomicrobium sp. TaxID=1911578 RepID=UPI0025E478FE|nr:hypothetical protein [Oryzomicrobium sp.]MCE1244949.1 hypothetical protein [Oryzomicrobium sp.]